MDRRTDGQTDGFEVWRPTDRQTGSSKDIRNPKSSSAEFANQEGSIEAVQMSLVLSNKILALLCGPYLALSPPGDSAKFSEVDLACVLVARPSVRPSVHLAKGWLLDNLISARLLCNDGRPAGRD